MSRAWAGGVSNELQQPRSFGTDLNPRVRTYSNPAAGFEMSPVCNSLVKDIAGLKGELEYNKI